MTAVLEQPEVIIQDHEPLEPADKGVSRQATRILFCSLDVLTPSRKRSTRRLKYGGHEVTANCLAHTYGFIQKGRLTPLTMSGEPILEENAPDGIDFFPLSAAPKTEIANALIMQGSESPIGAIPAYPGDEISSILNGSASEIDGRKIGLVEISALRGVKYKVEQVAPGLRVDRDMWEIQNYFFPKFPVVPVRLAEFRDLIMEGRRGTADSMIHSIAEDMLTSCDIGDLWANETLDAKERLIIQSRGHQGYAYVYDEMDDVLLAQTGREKVEQGMSKMVGQFAEIAQSGRADIAELGSVIAASNREFAAELAEQITRRLQPIEASDKPEDRVEPPKAEAKTKKKTDE